MLDKGIKNLFNKIIAENFPNLEKEMVIRYRSILENQQQGKKGTYQHHIVVKTQSVQNKKRIKMLQERHTKSIQRETHQNNSKFVHQNSKSKST
jgi:hypothetical protein